MARTMREGGSDCPATSHRRTRLSFLLAQIAKQCNSHLEIACSQRNLAEPRHVTFSRQAPTILRRRVNAGPCALGTAAEWSSKELKAEQECRGESARRAVQRSQWRASDGRPSPSGSELGPCRTVRACAPHPPFLTRSCSRSKSSSLRDRLWIKGDDGQIEARIEGLHIVSAPLS